jgi:hypothetical protein
MSYLMPDHGPRGPINIATVTKHSHQRGVGHVVSDFLRVVIVFAGLVIGAAGLISSGFAQDCHTQPDGSLACQCSSSAVNLHQCCSGNVNPSCVPNCAACTDPTDPTCCDPRIRGYVCTCVGPLFTTTGPLSYYLLAVTYEPPGNAGTAQYLNGTSLGSQVVIQVTSAGGTAVQITTPAAQLSANYLYGGIRGTSFQMTSNGSWGPQVTSNTDLINHLSDQFWLWTNVQMTATAQDNHYTSSLQPPPGQPVNVLNVSVAELAGLVPMPGYKAAQLANLSASDKATILKMDPFVSSTTGAIATNPTLDPSRFTFLNEHFQVVGPDAATDPPAGIALDTNTQAIHGAITGYMHQTGYTIAAGTTISFITGASFYAGVQYQYTYQKTTQANNGTITDAQGLLESKTTCWHQGVDLYWDGAFGTYLFSPTDAGSSDCGEMPKLLGHVTTMVQNGNLAPNQPISVPVTVTMPNGAIWRTQSNVHGEFKLFGLPANAAGGVQVSVAGQNALQINSFEGLTSGFTATPTGSGEVRVAFGLPQCQFSTGCPFYENQPPQYSLTCSGPADFYTWSGTPINSTTPPAGVLLAQGASSNTGSTTDSSVLVAACAPGTTNLCTSYSIDSPVANWCHSNKPPPPPPTCAQCGSGRKCCPDPDGGKGHRCVPLTADCPVLN